MPGTILFCAARGRSRLGRGKAPGLTGRGWTARGMHWLLLEGTGVLRGERLYRLESAAVRESWECLPSAAQRYKPLRDLGPRSWGQNRE